MPRTSKLLLWVIVVALSGGIILGYLGMAEPLVSPSQLPGSPVVGGAAVVFLLAVGAVLSGYLDRRAWTRVGREAGLAPGGDAGFDDPPGESGGSSFLGEPTLSGTVDGRPVRAWTYSVSRSEGSNKTYSVVEARLRNPVEWSGGFGGDPDAGPENHEVDAVETRGVRGIGVRGGVPDDVADRVGSGRVREALSGVDGEVSVGDLKADFVDDMLDALPEESESMAGTFAKGMLGVAESGGEGPSKTVGHRARGLVLDRSELDRRIEAVTAVADAVDRTNSTGS